MVLPPSFREAAQGTAADDSWSDQSEEDDSDSDSGSEEADTRPAVPADFPELARQLERKAVLRDLGYLRQCQTRM